MNVAYICDRKKCERCSPECLHTHDYNHALHKNYIPNIEELFEQFPEHALGGEITVCEKVNHPDYLAHGVRVL